ncbi:PEP-CTERM sorting domain-containing protein [Rhodoferax ferrireducens]|uniref:PEP-CTERM sorting domain-containing protein n=1 Tax=Rhodoferax ferrireducens TaxID=192843 RepID=UPI003BB6BBCD
MSTNNTVRRIRQIVSGALVSIASTAALASPAVSTVQLPGVNEMSAGLYGDFQVYSLDLLQQCSPTDPRCQPYVTNGPNGKVSSGPGQISTGVLIYQGGASGNNYDNASGPLNPLAPAGDNPFVPPQGTTSTYQFAAADEPTPPVLPPPPPGIPGFTGDQTGTWEITLAALADYLGIGTATPNNLIFLFDNNQQGAGEESQWLYMWASAAILDINGAQVGSQCYSLYANSWSGTCTNPTLVDPAFVDGVNTVANTSYVAIVGDFCVDKLTGVSYAATGNSCAVDATHTQGGYYITNNLGNSFAEFAAWNQALEDFVIANYLLHPDYVLSVNARFANMNDGPEQLWIGGTSFTNPPVLPEPGTLALLGLGFAAMWTASFRRRQS